MSDNNLSPTEVQLIEATKPTLKLCCIIPARKGSGRVKNKNKKMLLGRPLVDYAIKAAIDSGIFDIIIVSSDDKDILEYTYGYFDTQIIQPHNRPKTLCGNKVPIKVVVRYILEVYNTGNVISLIQPTNPLITANQIKEAYEVFKKGSPNYLIGMCNNKDIGFHIFKRDVFLKEYDMNFKGTNWIPFEMEGIDIDTEEDWKEAERLLSER